MDNNLGKKAETKIREWLDKQDQGYCFERIPDQLTGFYGSRNICDFYLYVWPNMYYIESKATWGDSFAFSALTEYQREEMHKKSKIYGVHSIVIVMFASYRRSFMFRISDIQESLDNPDNRKSLNVKHIDKWHIPYVEIPTVPNKRKQILDYTGDFESLVKQLERETEDISVDMDVSL